MLFVSMCFFSKNNPMKSWSSLKLAKWVQKCGKKYDEPEKFTQYAKKFLEKKIDGETFLIFELKDLKKLGIPVEHAEFLLKKRKK